MRFHLFAGAVAVMVFVTGSHASAAEIVVTQKDKAFDKDSVTLNKGDSIKFVNADKIAHNIHSRSPGDKFDLGKQSPGESSSRVFEKDGTFKVRCVIHPKMKLVVTVK